MIYERGLLFNPDELNQLFLIVHRNKYTKVVATVAIHKEANKILAVHYGRNTQYFSDGAILLNSFTQDILVASLCMTIMEKSETT